ncbi:MAG: 5-histidylcysteine sulfoxide synthase, partial [Candidatus Krumholzibacteriia bacterium]
MPHPVQNTPVLNVGTATDKRQEIRNYFTSTWELYERLFDIMNDDEAYYMKADPLRHPLIFYLGHTATFFVNKLTLARIITDRVNPHFESMFAIGVDEMSWDDINKNDYEWPSVADTLAYRDEVRKVVIEAIDTMEITIPISWEHPAWTILMGVEHERIHLETSSVLMRQLPLKMVKPDAAWPVCADTGASPTNALLPVPGGKVSLGKERSHHLYGWDNEYGKLERDIQSFKASQYLVSNGEFLEFVESGGYDTEKWWTAEGWSWRAFKEAAMPLFWRKAGPGRFRLRCLAEEIDMPWNWPAEVNQLEAKAFCNWKAQTTGRPVRL